jgi:hypothetical protein
LAFGLHRARGIAPSATRGAIGTAGAASDRGPGARAFAVSRALLAFAFVVYLTVVTLSSVGLKPLGGQSMALGLLGLGTLAGYLALRGRGAVGATRVLRGLGLTGASAARTASASAPSAATGPVEAAVDSAAFGSALAPARGPDSPPPAIAHSPAAATPEPGPPSLRWLGFGALGAGLLLTLGALALAWLLPVGAYDALGYRLPAVAQWLDAGAVVWVQGDDPLRNGYPLGLEVIEAAVFRALAAATAVDCVATLFVLAGAASLAGFARRLGLLRPAAALAAGLFLLVPMHLLNAPSGYADAAFAGVLVAFLVGVARWTEAAHTGSADHSARSADSSAASADDSSDVGVELGVAAALVIALKPHGFAFVAVGLGLGLLLRAQQTGLRAAARELGVTALFAAPGLFFALRNVVVTGNPLYPLEVRIGSHVLLRGEGSLDGILTPDFNVPPELAALSSLLRPWWVWLQAHGPAENFDDRLAGFGYAFLLVGLPALGWALARTLRRPAALRGLAVLGGLTFACWLLQPMAFWPRFTSWLWGAAALSIALLLTTLIEQGRERSAVAIAVATLLLALPEALYALAHVKRVDRFGLSSLLREDPIDALAQVAGVEADFVRDVLVGKRDVCRTPWRLGTDDANLDGVVAQLLPRPRMHVLKETQFAALIAAAQARGCKQLIVIGDNPVVARVPSSWAERSETVTAFGPCRLIPVMSSEVTP